VGEPQGSPTSPLLNLVPDRTVAPAGQSPAPPAESGAIFNRRQDNG